MMTTTSTAPTRTDDDHHHAHDDDDGDDDKVTLRPQQHHSASPLRPRSQSSLPLTGRRALILGGGPAGLSLALSLHQRGCEIQVHEKSTYEEEAEMHHQNNNTMAKMISDRGGFGYLLMPNGVSALDALGVKQCCLANARALESAEIYKREREVETVTMDGIYCLARSDLLSGMERMLLLQSTTEGGGSCVKIIRGSQVVEIEAEGDADQTVVTAVKVAEMASGKATWLRLRRHFINHDEQQQQEEDNLDNTNVFDYIFAADGVHSLLAKRLNPDMNRCLGGTTNTVVTCVKDEDLARRMSTRFIKTYFRSKKRRQCCAFGLLSPANGMMLGFLQFSTVFHGQAPHNSQKNMRAEIHSFIEDVLALPSSSSSVDEPENICMLRTYLKALSRNDYDYHVWRFAPSGYVRYAHGINCAVLGDAAHSMSDFSSQGLSLAIQDAVSLGNHLASLHAAVKGMDMERPGSTVSSSALANYDFERRGIVSQFVVAGDWIHGNFLSECDDDDSGDLTAAGEISDAKLIDGVDQPFTVHGQVRRLSSLSSHSSSVQGRVYDNGDDGFLDPKLVDMKTLSTVAYNYRWATLPDGVIPLTAASSDFPVCPAITSALKNHVDAGYFCYGPNEGLPQFREAFATYFGERLARGLAYCIKEQEDNKTTLYGTSSIEARQVMATNAAAAAVYAAAAATILEPGDEALVMSPVDFLLVDSVIAMGGVVIRYSIKERLRDGKSSNPTFDLVEMESLVTPRTRMLSICNPHNPLGRSFSYRELSELVDFAERHQLSIVTDEVWCDVVHAPRVHVPTMSISQYAAAHTYSIFGFSKSHGLEGLRIGALVAPNHEKLAQVLQLSNTNTTANGASVAAQIAAIAAMSEAGSHETGWLALWRLHLHVCVLHTVTRLNAMKGVIAKHPEATFVVWADVSSLLYPDDDDDSTTPLDNDDIAAVDAEPEFVLMQWLIREHKVAIIPGLDRFFGPGSTGHIRISVATSKPILDAALDRLEIGLKIWPEVRESVLREARVEAS